MQPRIYCNNFYPSYKRRPTRNWRRRTECSRRTQCCSSSTRT
uniref:Uncharacterized protein n=1 Tax=Anguilla anguilla TaxID=7936 RepID=A0A0E9SKI6_ANGAN